MRVHVLQHVPFEGIGNMATWFTQQDISLSYTRWFANDPLPEWHEIDGLVVMGGPMSVHDSAVYPWLTVEKAFINEGLRHKKPMLGVCLGAQLLAEQLGATVSQNPVKEIGWLPVQANTHHTCVSLPSPLQAFHWHGETFSLPAGAQSLAYSAACAQQAFQYGQHVIGLQFHLEITPAGVEQLIEHAAADYAQPSATVQTPAQLRAASVETYTNLANTMYTILAYLFTR